MCWPLVGYHVRIKPFFFLWQALELKDIVFVLQSFEYASTKLLSANCACAQGCLLAFASVLGLEVHLNFQIIYNMWVVYLLCLAASCSKTTILLFSSAICRTLCEYPAGPHPDQGQLRCPGGYCCHQGHLPQVSQQVSESISGLRTWAANALKDNCPYFAQCPVTQSSHHLCNFSNFNG